MSKELRLHLEMAEEVKRLTMEGLEFNAALRKVKEMYKEKAHSPATTQGNELDTKTTNCIISDKEYIDNGEIFDKSTGQTIGDLIWGGYENE